MVQSEKERVEESKEEQRGNKVKAKTKRRRNGADVARSEEERLDFYSASQTKNALQ